ncbi:hypothetical protein GCK32_008040 [Trichostrongylus colubriformis]|uniref:Fucosyltransferase n=1 Tax=Trichostrongylus colubriformis TaxID=6319 RepID=A0AAN8G0E4_TRICO
MERVQHNDTEFLKYFEWTKHYRKPSCYVSDAACRLCADLHAERKHRVQDIHVVNRFAHQCHNNEFVIG